MKIESIKSAGASNILKWAIRNNAELMTFTALRDIISDETYYLVTLSDVNFFEVFRFVQMFREKLRIVTRDPVAVPSDEQLATYFPGKATANDGTGDMKLADMVKMTAESFMNLSLQMNADNDIISPEITQLYSSMLTMKYTIQFPLGFQDFISAFSSKTEIDEIFNSSYPETLENVLQAKVGDKLERMIQLIVVKTTSIIRYSKEFEQLLGATKYSFLKKAKFNNKMYRYALTSFHKFDPISHSEVRCNMFKANKNEMARLIDRMKHMHSPLKVSFVVQLPIYYMMMIENYFSRQELPISYESSMSSIIAEDIPISDFVSNEHLDPESEDYKERLNSISAYKSRIEESKQALLTLIPILIDPERECDITNTFALLPPAFTTKAIITVSSEHEAKYRKHFDATVAGFLTELMFIANSILR